MTGTTDFHEIATSEKPSHKLAFNIFVDRVCQYIGGYFVQLEGKKDKIRIRFFFVFFFFFNFFLFLGKVDAVVFAVGLGENSPELRRAILARCACLGFDAVADEKNENSEHSNVVYDIGKGTGKVRALVCETNEEVCLFTHFMT